MSTWRKYLIYFLPKNKGCLYSRECLNSNKYGIFFSKFCEYPYILEILSLYMSSTLYQSIKQTVFLLVLIQEYIYAFLAKVF